MVKKSRGGQTLNSSAEIEKNVTSRKLKKKKIGAILIEVAFTLPIVVYLMFFCIELIKINITREALQSICEEATYLTIAHDYETGAKLVEKIDAIIEKYRPSFIPKEDFGYPGYGVKYPVIRWYFAGYASLNEILANVPYGGSCIAYPHYEADAAVRTTHECLGHQPNNTQYIPSQNQEYYEYPINWRVDRGYMQNEGLPNNRVFVLTITCNYPFSSSMVKMLFGGGVNTKKISANGNVGRGLVGSADKCDPGTMYLLWARGAGIVNSKQ